VFPELERRDSALTFPVVAATLLRQSDDCPSDWIRVELSKIYGGWQPSVPEWDGGFVWYDADDVRERTGSMTQADDPPCK
jgi:hypothetical protein